eukprot:SM000005S17305  [mRNA]  locus=s5:1289373:1296436:+ [translate_table: standard]
MGCYALTPHSCFKKIEQVQLICSKGQRSCMLPWTTRVAIYGQIESHSLTCHQGASCTSRPQSLSSLEEALPVEGDGCAWPAQKKNERCFEGATEAVGTQRLKCGHRTGNAQDVAERVAREARRLSLAPAVAAMDAVDVTSLLAAMRVVFVAATTGQGDPPDNMKRFWRQLLRKSLGPAFLGSLQYAVFGLGDSGYEKYNVVAKKLDRRLQDLGATPMVSRGLGDDQHPSGYEAALDPWLAALWVSGQLLNARPNGLFLAQQGPLELDRPRYEVVHHPYADTSNGRVSIDERLEGMRAFHQASLAASRFQVGGAVPLLSTPSDDSALGYGPLRPYIAELVANERLTAKDWEQDVRHIEFELGTSGTTYAPGDVVSMYPEQPPEAVQRLLARLSYDCDAAVTVHVVPDASSSAGDVETVPHTPAAQPIRVAALIAGALDISSASPRRYFFEVLSHFAEEEREAERLRYFSTAEGREDLYDYNQRERRSVLEILEDFPSVQLPLHWLLEIAPRLQPRAFSIASSLRAHPQRLEVVASVVKVVTPYNRTRFGLCSNWLAQMAPSKGGQVPLWVSRGFLRLPPATGTPLILVGPGTGCAPFRSFLEERACLLQEGQGPARHRLQLQNGSLGPNILQPAPCLFFFGCRKEHADFLYKEQWRLYQAAGGILSEAWGSGFYAAFSRDQAHKVYVQHKIQEAGQRVWELVLLGANIYIAGSAQKMPSDVKRALQRVAEHEGGLTLSESNAWLRQMEQTGRLSVEACFAGDHCNNATVDGRRGKENKKAMAKGPEEDEPNYEEDNEDMAPKHY